MTKIFFCWFFLLIWKIQLTQLFVQQGFVNQNNYYKKEEHSILFDNESIFAPVWTSWSQCNNHCKQVREKHCINPEKCANLVLREQRHCTNNIRCQRISNVHNTNGNHIPVKPNFQQSLMERISLEPITDYQYQSMKITNEDQTIGINRPSNSHHYITSRQEHALIKNKNNTNRQFSNNNNMMVHHEIRKVPQQGQQLSIPSSSPVYNQGYHYHNTNRLMQKFPNTTNFNSVLLNNEIHSSASLPNHDVYLSNSNRIIKQNKINNSHKFTNLKRNLYTKWSNWTKCSRSCTTQRYKYCKKKGMCKKNVIKETAYCYVEGSPCHRWIADHFGINYDDDSEEVESNFGSNNENDYDYKIEEIPNSYQKPCGVSLISNSYEWPKLRIVGGRVSAKDKWPWQVVLLNKHKIAFCGGTLIAPQWVLTAAHCLRKHLYVRINEHDLSYKDGTEIEFRIRKKIAHNDYNSETVDNDIALLKLPVEVSQSYVCLPRHNQTLPYNMMCTITGWGKRHVKDERGTKFLHEAEACLFIVIIDNKLIRFFKCQN